MLGEKLCWQVKELQEWVSKLCSIRDDKKSLTGSSQRPFREESLNPQTVQKEGQLETEVSCEVNEGAWKHVTSGKRRQALHLHI